MDSQVTAWLEILFRWIHGVAGIAWIGHLYFFNFVNAQLVKTYDADSKKKVVPELMPRALYWFRWGAAFTWITGFLLLGLVFYMGRITVTEASGLSNHLGMAIGLGTLVVGFAVYDGLWKSPLGKNEMAAAAVSYVLLVAIAFGLSQVFEKRAVAIHVGSLLGTIMAANVWMRIWPAQRKIIAGIKGTAAAPDASVAALAGLRSKHNTYMSVPLVLMMLNQHALPLLGDLNWLAIAVATLLGWGAVKFLYTKSASAAPAQF